MAADLLAELDRARRRAPDQSTATMRRLRRALSRTLRDTSREAVLALAEALVARDGPADRFLGYELVAAHPACMTRLTLSEVNRLGRGLSDWVGVDCFACYVAGPAWRTGRLSDAAIARWVRSTDRWWRRAGIVSTVPLNARSRGGSGDRARTLRVAALAVGDRDPMVVKALSWALRELAKRDPVAARAFLATHGDALAPLVRREVANKLDTGLKQPRRRST
jgi:3-methyladenine DNA glycosylase AlkD